MGSPRSATRSETLYYYPMGYGSAPVEERVKVARIDFALCRACLDCPAKKACRTKAIIKMGLDEEAIVKPSDCMGCGDCLEACPHGALTLKET